MRQGVTDAWGPLRRGLVRAAQAVADAVDERGRIPAKAWDKFQALLFAGWVDSAQAAVKATITRKYADQVVASPLVDAELRAQDWIDKHGLELVEDLTAGSRAAVNATLRQALREGWDVPRMVRRIKDTAGLNERFARAVVNMDNRLRRAGKDPAKIDAAVRRYSDKLLRARAEMVARTETVAARNEGHLQSWIQMQSEGDLPSRARKVWVAAPRIACEICQDLAGQAPRAFDEPFDGPDGPIQRPPSHTSCRCSLGVV
jgi:hypothetical protein